MTNENDYGTLYERLRSGEAVLSVIGPGRIVMSGLAFGENCPDLGNNRVADMIGKPVKFRD